MKGFALFAVLAIACIGSTEPCVPVIGTGCRYVAVTVYENGQPALQVRTAVFDPCLPKEESDRRFPGWTVAPDTIKSCPPPRGGLRP
jgi:hypothetical protein